MTKLGWTVLLVLALGATTAWAQGPPAEPGDEGDGMFGEELLGFGLGLGPGPGLMMGDGICMMGEGGGMMHGGRGGMRGGPGMMRGGRGMGPGLGGGMQRGALLEELELTDAQREKLGDLRDAQMRRGIQARADLRIAALDLRKLLIADKPNRVAIDAQIDRIARMQADLHKAQVASMLEARSVLTPEQRQKLRALRGRPGPPPAR
jgi:Spy/CpxP family protein refolding chaperone